MAVTPKTGAIKFSELNTCILNVGSTNTVKLSDAGKRIGYAGQYGGSVKMSDLRGCWGYQITTGFASTGGKFPTTVSGYRALGDSLDVGSINPSTVSGSQTCVGTFTSSGGGGSNTYIWFGGTIDAAYEGVDVNRFGYGTDALVYPVASDRANTTLTEIDMGFGVSIIGDGSTVDCCVRFG